MSNNNKTKPLIESFETKLEKIPKATTPPPPPPPAVPMVNNEQSSVEWFAKESWNLQIRLENKEITVGEYGVTYVDLLNQAKAMQQEQAQLYATFVLKCVKNNLPPITFNDWINLEKNEQ